MHVLLSRKLSSPGDNLVKFQATLEFPWLYFLPSGTFQLVLEKAPPVSCAKFFCVSAIHFTVNCTSRTNESSQMVILSHLRSQQSLQTALLQYSSPYVYFFQKNFTNYKKKIQLHKAWPVSKHMKIPEISMKLVFSLRNQNT